MNIFVVVEGEIGERYVYEKWIPLVNPELSVVNNIFEIRDNNFAIISGGGFPNYFEVIENAIQDVNIVDNVDRLVVSVDSEEMTFNDKFDEIQHFLSDKVCSAQLKIIIQHFCLETWALGNKKVCPHHPKSATLRNYKMFFNVLDKDPELLPSYPPKNWNRSQFAYRYLRKMLNEKNKRMTYTKGNPSFLLHHKYFTQVKNRYEKIGHIISFSTFLEAFI